MKKTMLMIGIVSIFAVGSAFAGENQASSGKSGHLYNGITYFDLGPASTCQDPAPMEPATAKPSNGITVFDLGQPGSGVRGSCAGQMPDRVMMSKRYNGITVF